MNAAVVLEGTGGGRAADEVCSVGCGGGGVAVPPFFASTVAGLLGRAVKTPELDEEGALLPLRAEASPLMVKCGTCFPSVGAGGGGGGGCAADWRVGWLGWLVEEAGTGAAAGVGDADKAAAGGGEAGAGVAHLDRCVSLLAPAAAALNRGVGLGAALPLS